MLRIALILVVTVAVIVGAVALIGSRLPVAHVATRSAIIPAPPDSVFAVIADFAAAPSWRPGLKEVVMEAGGPGNRPRFTEVTGNDRLTMEVEALVAPSRLVTRIVGEGLPFGGAWAYAAAPEGTGTRVTITEHGEVYNPIFRFVSKYIMGQAGTIESYLRNLGKRFGADVVPAEAPVVPL